MSKVKDKSVVTWSIHLASAPGKAYEFLATDEGRKRWWSSRSRESGDVLELGFGTFRILERRHAELFKFTYIGDTNVAIQVVGCAEGGTDLTVVESGIPNEAHFLESYPGWVEVLLVLKGAVDFGIDLRSHKPDKTWDQGFVDV